MNFGSVMLKILSDHNWIMALATVVIMALTIVLTWVGIQQINQTKILQRAYLSVVPLGIKRFRSGQAFFSCDIGIRNVGHLPAINVRWSIDRVFNDDRFFNGLEIKENRFQGSNVIPPGTESIKGGERIESASFVAGTRRGGETWLCVGRGSL